MEKKQYGSGFAGIFLGSIALLIAVFALAVFISSQVSTNESMKGKSLVWINSACTQNSYNAGRLASDCENLCKSKNSSCLQWGGKGCNLEIPTEDWFDCKNKDGLIQKFVK